MSTSWFYLFFGSALVCYAGAKVTQTIASGAGPLNIQGYIVNMVLVCPSDPQSIGFLQVTSERSLYAVAECGNGLRNFTVIDIANKRLILDPQAGDIDPDLCRLMQLTGSDTYTVVVHGGWGEYGNEVITPLLSRTVYCSYDNFTKANRQAPITITDAIQAPKVIQEMMGSADSVRVNMNVVNLFDESIDGKSFALGRLVRLRATPVDGKSYLRAISCFAGNSAQKAYKIIRDGCGDGIVFNRSAGFTLDNDTRIEYSPYFVAFKLPGADDIFFECDFLLCETFCEESCAHDSRRRRDAVTSAEENALHRKLSTVTGYVIMKEPEEINNPMDGSFQFIGYPRPRDARRVEPTTIFSHIKIIAAISVLGAMLLVAMLTLLVVCYRQSSQPQQNITIAPLATKPPIMPMKPIELNNNA